MNDERYVSLISWLSAGTVAMIALFSFAISYVAQRELALASGIHPWLAYIFPLVIDGFIVFASLSVLRNSLVGESSKYQWSMVAFFTILSIVFNAAHAYDVLLEITIAGLPVTLIPHVAMPLALFFGFEMLMRQVQNAIERYGAIKSVRELRAEHERLRAELDREIGTQRTELDRLAAESDRLEGEISDKTAQIAALDQNLAGSDKSSTVAGERRSSANVGNFVPGDLVALDKANQTRTEAMWQRRQAIHQMFREGRSVGELAEHFQVDIKTIQRDAEALEIELIGRGRAAKMNHPPLNLSVSPGNNGARQPSAEAAKQ